MTNQSARTPQEALDYLLKLSDELNDYLQRGEFHRTATPDQRELIKGLRAVVQGISSSFGRSIGISVSHIGPVRIQSF